MDDMAAVSAPAGDGDDEEDDDEEEEEKEEEEGNDEDDVEEVSGVGARGRRETEGRKLLLG